MANLTDVLGNHPTPKYMGYCTEIPFTKGDVVRIRKGTPFTFKGKIVVAKRSYDVVVHHTLPGMSNTGYNLNRYHGANLPVSVARVMFPCMNPRVVWAGTGGYWCDVDINYLLNASDLPENNLVEEFVAFATKAMELVSLDHTSEFSLFISRSLVSSGVCTLSVDSMISRVRALANSENETSRIQSALLLETAA